MGWLLRISSDRLLDLDEQDDLQSRLWDLATTGVAETPPGDLIAGFNTEAEANQALSALEARPHLTVSVEAVDPDLWSSSTPEVEMMLGSVAFTMEVGAAFGHGEHPTTRLANDLLTDELQRKGGGARVLDFGTGTGILALTSLGAGATSIVAVDNDPAARAIAKGNIERAIDTLGLRTQVTAAVEPALATVSGTASRKVASNTPLYDVVAANVLLVVHREFGRRLAAAVRPGGALVVSGFVREQRDEVVALYSEPRSSHDGCPNDGYPNDSVADFAIEKEATNDDWLALRLRAMVI